MMKKDNEKKDMDRLLERLIQKAEKWEAEKDSPHENNPVDQELRDKQDANREDEEN